MANQHLLFSETLPLNNPEECEWLETRLFELEPEPNFDWEIQGDKLWVYSEDRADNLDELGSFLQTFLREFRAGEPEAFFTLTYAVVSSSPREGAYCGGAMLVTPERIERLCAGEWVDNKAWGYIESKEERSFTCACDGVEHPDVDHCNRCEEDSQ